MTGPRIDKSFEGLIRHFERELTLLSRRKGGSGGGGPVVVPPASETVPGIIELATQAETVAGTDAVRAVTPATLKAVADGKAALAHTHTASQITDFSTAADARVNALVPTATTAVQGKVELATSTEVQTGTDTTRAVTPSGLSARTATETRTGIARLATQQEAWLFPTSIVPSADIANTIMSPQRTKDMIDAFAPVVGKDQNSLQTTDWNTAVRVGFYKSYSGAANNPPGGTGNDYIGIVQNSGYSGYNAGGAGWVIQELWEVSATDVLINTWRRTQNPDLVWSAWASNSANTARPGIVELATTAETTTGTDTTRAVTPAGLKAVADTKASSTHGHALTDSNITGVLPVAQVPTLDLATKTSGTLAIARGGTGATTAAAALTNIGAAAATHGHALTDANMTGVLPVAQLPAATTSARGGIEIATQAEVDAGTDTVRAVTPATLKATLPPSALALPGPYYAYGPGATALTSAASSWRSFAADGVLVEITPARDLVVDVAVNAICKAQSGGGYVMIGAYIAGGLVLQPDADVNTGTQSSHLTPFTSSTVDTGLMSPTKRVTIPAGVLTQFSLWARRSVSSGTHSCNYPMISVLPVRWA